MQKLKYAIIILITLLSLAAGGAKVMQMPQELEFLSAIGLTPTTVLILGVIQVLGGVLISIPRTRLIGAVIAGLAFLVSVVALLMHGNVGMGLFSLLPVVATGFIAFWSKNNGTQPHP